MLHPDPYETEIAPDHAAGTADVVEGETRKTTASPEGI